MKTERFEPGNVVPTAVMPMETAVFAGICDKSADLRRRGDHHGLAGGNGQGQPGRAAHVDRERDRRAGGRGLDVSLHVADGDRAIQIERLRGVGFDAERALHLKDEAGDFRESFRAEHPVLADRRIAVGRFVAVHVHREARDHESLVHEIAGGHVDRGHRQRVAVIERGRVAGVGPRRLLDDPHIAGIDDHREVPGDGGRRVRDDLPRRRAARDALESPGPGCRPPRRASSRWDRRCSGTRSP